jgi:hypothetical protein
MRAIVVDPGAPGRLALKEIAMPHPATNQALVRVAAISLTPSLKGDRNYEIVQKQINNGCIGGWGFSRSSECR